MTSAGEAAQVSAEERPFSASPRALADLAVALPDLGGGEGPLAAVEALVAGDPAAREARIAALGAELAPRLVGALGGEPERLAAAFGAWSEIAARAGRERPRAAGAEVAAALRSAWDGLLFVGADARVRVANGPAARLLGRDEGALAGAPLAELVVGAGSAHAIDLAACARAGPAALAGKRVEAIARHADGSERRVEIFATPVDGGGGAAVLLLRDLSDRRREDEGIAIWTHVLEQSDFGVVVVEAASRNIRFVNPRFARLYGYDDVDDLVGRRVEEVIAAEWTPEFERVLVEIERKGHHTYEAIQRRRDGSLFPALVSTTLIRGPAGHALRVSNVVDVTERRQAAEVRERARELEAENRRVIEASRLKSEFLANMSHELRTPLNSIIGFAEILSSGDVPASSPEHDEFLGDILASGQHLLRLINDVLDLSKIEAGKLDLRPERTTFAAVASEVASIVRPVAIAKDVRVELEPGPPIDIHLDPARLKQVLYNYASNAIKFTPPGGLVTLRGLPDGDDAFRVEVVDTGIGIASDDLARLFVEFQQLDAGLSKRHGGTGLGLALTKRLVEAQGGTVGVTAAPGQGSTFFAILPRAGRGGAQLPEPRVYAARTPGAPRVLVVEDDPEDQAFLVETLVKEGFEVEAVATGAQAIARAAERRFDAITLDVVLPDTSGLQVLARIRRSGPSVAAKVVVVTVSRERGVVGALKIDDFITKPVDPQLLVQALRRLGVAPLGGDCVLVVDDDPTSVRLVRAALGPQGYRVEGAANGAAALAFVAATRPAAIVLDLLMPVMDGFEFLARIRADGDLRELPVVIWTSKDLSVEERLLLRDGALSVVRKGGGAATLVEEIVAAAPKPSAS